MKWIVLVIVLGLGAYTYLTLHYRKQHRSFEPYEDIRDRANTLRLLSAGFQRITVNARRPADPQPIPGGAAITPGPGGLPEALRVTLVAPPQLPADYLRVTAAPSGNTLVPYPVQFTCSVGDHHQQFAGVRLYLRADQIMIVPEFERLGGQLLARSRESFVLVTVPAGALKPGRYQVSLIGARTSQTWPLQVH
jgi:hypothetical protein